MLGLLGIYQDGLVKTSIDTDPVSAHLFEYTSTVELTVGLKASPGVGPPIQTLFCLKEKNAKKVQVAVV